MKMNKEDRTYTSDLHLHEVGGGVSTRWTDSFCAIHILPRVSPPKHVIHFFASEFDLAAVGLGDVMSIRASGAAKPHA